MPKLLHPDAVRARCARQFAREHLGWLRHDASSDWPQAIPLGAPTQNEAADDPVAVRAWIEAWNAWELRQEPGEILWETRQWPRLGSQRLPASLKLASAVEVARLADQATRWNQAVGRHTRLIETCAGLKVRPATQRLFDALADYSDADFDRLLSLMRWVDAHPSSGLQMRQLPIAGLDTKWVEQRRGLIVDLSLARLEQPLVELAGRDLHALLGLAKPPKRLRLRVLGEDLRRQLGGLSDIEAPIADLADIPIAPKLVLIVENLESGLALPPMPGTVSLMKLGHAVNLVQQLPWLRDSRVVVWGDIDTHGFAILDRARGALPQAESMLMDAATLLDHRILWVEEGQPYSGPPLDRLTAQEKSVFDGLTEGMWGPRVRLEQERLPWSQVMATLVQCCVLFRT
jgi:hypothetical protein